VILSITPAAAIFEFFRSVSHVPWEDFKDMSSRHRNGNRTDKQTNKSGSKFLSLSAGASALRFRGGKGDFGFTSQEGNFGS
jgi:hypothetical protein